MPRPPSGAGSPSNSPELTSTSSSEWETYGSSASPSAGRITWRTGRPNVCAKS